MAAGFGTQHVGQHSGFAGILRGSLWISSWAASWLRALVRFCFPCPQHRTDSRMMRGVRNANCTAAPICDVYLDRPAILTIAPKKGLAFRSSQTFDGIVTAWCTSPESSAGQGVAADLQSVEVAQDGHRNPVRLEQFVRRLQQAFGRYPLYALDDLVHAEKAVVVHFLPR
jgi:hypothetical protein